MFHEREVLPKYRKEVSVRFLASLILQLVSVVNVLILIILLVISLTLRVVLSTARIITAAAVAAVLAAVLVNTVNVASTTSKEGWVKEEEMD